MRVRGRGVSFCIRTCACISMLAFLRGGLAIHLEDGHGPGDRQAVMTVHQELGVVKENASCCFWGFQDLDHSWLVSQERYGRCALKSIQGGAPGWFSGLSVQLRLRS